MEFLVLIAAVCLAVLAWSFRSSTKKLPPGPTPLPIVGNLFQVGKNPHLTFAKMSNKYGPLMSIRFGATLNVVVTSPELTKELLIKQDVSDRHPNHAQRAHDHHKLSISFTSVTTDTWRELRRVSKQQIFAHHSLEAGQPLRQEKLRQLLDHVAECCDGGLAVDIRRATYTTVLNILSATFFSTEATGFESDFAGLVDSVIDTFLAPNIADFFPILERFDLQSARCRADAAAGRMLEKIRGYIDQRLEWRMANPNAPKKNDALEALLDFIVGNEFGLSLDNVEHFLLVSILCFNFRSNFICLF